KLLAPTVLVSLALVIACIFAALSLNYLHVNLSRELTENIESTRVAQDLEDVTERLARLLRGDPSDTPNLEREVEAFNKDAEQLLKRATDLANLEEERSLVPKVAQAFEAYLKLWSVHKGSRVELPRMAQLLDREVVAQCKQLRDFNLGQIERSN